MAEANWALKTRQEIVQRFACCRAPDAVTDTSVSKQKTCVFACAVHEKWLAVSVAHQGINNSLSFSVWTIRPSSRLINQCAGVKLKNFSLLSSRRPSSCKRLVSRLQSEYRRGLFCHYHIRLTEWAWQNARQCTKENEKNSKNVCKQPNGKVV